jgi:hypothetical protein
MLNNSVNQQVGLRLLLNRGIIHADSKTVVNITLYFYYNCKNYLAI